MRHMNAMAAIMASGLSMTFAAPPSMYEAQPARSSVHDRAQARASLQAEKPTQERQGHQVKTLEQRRAMPNFKIGNGGWTDHHSPGTRQRRRRLKERRMRGGGK